jgi:hypothetical protein
VNPAKLLACTATPGTGHQPLVTAFKHWPKTPPSSAIPIGDKNRNHPARRSEAPQTSSGKNRRQGGLELLGNLRKPGVSYARRLCETLLLASPGSTALNPRTSHCPVCQSDSTREHRCRTPLARQGLAGKLIPFIYRASATSTSRHRRTAVLFTRSSLARIFNARRITHP